MSDEAINKAWKKFKRPASWQSAIGDIHEGKIVGDLVNIFAQLGEPSCMRAVKRVAEATRKVDDGVLGE